jgi:hypothetical protein
MDRLFDYFVNAQTVKAESRTVGVEIETLFIDEKARPISLAVSQKIWRCLAVDFSWTVVEEKAGMLVELEKQGFRLIYELSRHNFELTTPATLLKDSQNLFADSSKFLAEIFQAAKKFGAWPLVKGWDGFWNNTLILPDRRDEIWVRLDGLPALSLLGHTSCLHFNLDLCSIEEGLRFMRQLQEKYQELGWPAMGNGWAWRQYLKSSKAEYEPDRYGWPPLESLRAYCRKLSSFRVVMNKIGDEVEIAKPVLKFFQNPNPDINLFLRSVWWIFRLRVRGGKLVLEIRDVPRAIPLNEAWEIIKNTSGI